MTRIVGPPGSRRRRRFLAIPVLLTMVVGLLFIGTAAAVHDLDFQLDDADRPAPVKPAPEKAAVAAASFGHPAGSLELDKLDLSFNPDRPAFDDATPSVLDGQWHDAATKLDLAKAYQEMGDTDGAREILQEVLHEGDDQQKSEAQGLLAKLAS